MRRARTMLGGAATVGGLIVACAGLALTLPAAAHPGHDHPACAHGASSIPEVGPYHGYKVVHITGVSDEQYERCFTVGELWSCEAPRTGFDLFVPPDGPERLRAMGIPNVVVIDDVQAWLDAVWSRDMADHARRDITWFQSYRTFAEINTYMDNLAAQFPTRVSIFNTGNSLEGRAIRGLRITAPGSTATRPALFFNATQHAREWISPMSVMFIADQLARDFDTDPRVRALLNNAEFLIVPVVNPDGYVFSWASSNNRLWRKNRRNNGTSFGVDLNRNWGFGWGGQGASATPSSDIYRGPSAFSEPETQRLRDFITANPRIEAVIDFHAFSQLILSPWGYQSTLPADNALFTQLNTRMASAIRSFAGLSYTAGPTFSTIYPASGVSGDWAYGARGVLGWGWELRPATNPPGFAPAASEIIPSGEESYLAVLALADYIASPLTFSFPSGVPTFITPAQSANVRVAIGSTYVGTLAPGSVKLFFRVGNSGSFTEGVVNAVNATTFDAVLPANACQNTIEYYFEAQTSGGLTARFPLAGAEAPLRATAAANAVTLADAMEAASGWTVGATGDTATTGIWNRGVPEGTFAQPVEDNTPAPGVNAWMTDTRAGNNAAQFDVNGITSLTSPIFNGTSAAVPGGTLLITYARWYSNDQGPNPGTNSLLVQVSRDGGSTWNTLETVTENARRWVTVTRSVSNPTASMRLRFVARNTTGAVVEAGVDDLVIAVTGCPVRRADVDGNGTVDINDFFAYLALFASNDARADFDSSGFVDVNDFFAFLDEYSRG